MRRQVADARGTRIRGWHPEFIRPRESPKRILVVGAGPAGLEAARALGVRGYSVTLIEATRELGGRVAGSEGYDVRLVTPAAQVPAWTVNTMEVVKIQRRVLQAGVSVHCNSAVIVVGSDHVVHRCVYTGEQAELAANSVLMVTSRPFRREVTQLAP
jgi:NADPH-dependent 2,4-dienoyl-CoA reductase/sulfur reductase-like enzyme